MTQQVYGVMMQDRRLEYKLLRKTTSWTHACLELGVGD